MVVDVQASYKFLEQAHCENQNIKNGPMKKRCNYTILQKAYPIKNTRMVIKLYA